MIESMVRDGRSEREIADAVGGGDVRHDGTGFPDALVRRVRALFGA